MSGPDYVFTSSSSKTEVLFAQYYDHILTKVNFRKPPRCSAILPISKKSRFVHRNTRSFIEVHGPLSEIHRNILAFITSKIHGNFEPIFFDFEMFLTPLYVSKPPLLVIVR